MNFTFHTDSNLMSEIKVKMEKEEINFHKEKCLTNSARK